MNNKQLNIILMIMLVLLIIWQYTSYALILETHILQVISHFRTTQLTSIITTITNSVSIVYYSLMTLLLVICYYIKYRQIPWLLPLPLIINAILFYCMKIVIHRPRPTTMLIYQYDFSFPSGHTLSSMIMVYVTILFMKSMYIHTVYKYLMIIGGMYVSIIIMTRLYLGVHFPSDILASLVLGSLIIINSYQYILRKLRL